MEKEVNKMKRTSRRKEKQILRDSQNEGYYVYVWAKGILGNLEPYYIGKGKDDRAIKDEKNIPVAYNSEVHGKNYFSNLNELYLVGVELSEGAAYQLENDLIKRWDPKFNTLSGSCKGRILIEGTDINKGDIKTWVQIEEEAKERFYQERIQALLDHEEDIQTHGDYPWTIEEVKAITEYVYELSDDWTLSKFSRKDRKGKPYHFISFNKIGKSVSVCVKKQKTKLTLEVVHRKENARKNGVKVGKKYTSFQYKVLGAIEEIQEKLESQNHDSTQNYSLIGNYDTDIQLSDLYTDFEIVINHIDGIQ